MSLLDANQVAALLDELGQRSAFIGGNPYKARAYRTAAESISSLTDPLEKIISRDELTTIPGVGDAIAAVIKELHKTGTHLKLESLRKEVPEGLLELVKIPNLRIQQAQKLYEANIKTIPALQQALESGKLNEIGGFTPAFQTKLKQSLDILKNATGKYHLNRAEDLLKTAQINLAKSNPELTNVTIAGDFRRGCELVSDLSLIAISKVKSKKNSTKLGNGISLHTCLSEDFGSMLLFATGSEAHLRALQILAKKKRLSLSEKGLKKGKSIIASKTEQDIYKALGLPFIEPELREGNKEIQWAQKKKLPKLVELKDLKGIVHAHTTSSDGIHTLEQMAEAVRTRGFQYFGISDHSQSAHYAGGLKEDEIIAQQKEIDRLNKNYGKKFHIFKGIESDILTDGSLDYPEKILKKFGFVIASVHSQFRLDKKTQTQRIIRAVSNPYTTILGHMTGRQLLRRPGYEVDIEKILKACAKYGVAVEINANPWRLDVDWRWHQKALEFGCMMSINPDAHSTSEIDLTKWGVAMARKGGVPKERVLNCLDLKSFNQFINKRK